MSSKHFCAHCNEEFVSEETTRKPRCPKCMRRSGIEGVRDAAPHRFGKRRWLAAAALVFVAAGIGYALYRASTVALEEQPPTRPLEAREVVAYLEREEVDPGPYASMLVLPAEPAGWPESPADIAARLHEESAPWSLEHPLPREVHTAEETLARLAASDDRVRLYPLEAAAAMTALLRAQGRKAMVAETWELADAQAPADPSGLLGYFVTAVYEGRSETPSAYFDPWSGGGRIDPSAVRVLTDIQVIGAALGIEASRVFARSGDGAAALRAIETALTLDPRSPPLRVSHAIVLAESGGLPDGIRELQAAIELRPDAPRRLSLAQLYLAQAGMLELSGEPDAADSQLTEANRIVTAVVERWPRYGRAHLALATIHLGLDDPDRARVELETAEALSPQAPMVWAAWAQYHLADRDPVSATTKMRRAVDLDPENWQLRLQAAAAFQRAGDEGAARASVEAALDLVAPQRRSEVRAYVERMMGSLLEGPATGAGADRDDDTLDLPEPVVSAPPGAGDADGPALMLGDPSNLRLRDPDQTLQLDLDDD